MTMAPTNNHSPFVSPAMRGKALTPLSISRYSSPDDTEATPAGGTAVKRTLASKFTPMTGARSRRSVLPDFTPSATMTESLNNLARGTAEKLDKTFNEMGYSPEDRSAAVQRLLQKYQDVSSEVVAFHQHEVEKFRADIEKMKKTIFKTAKALGIEPDHQLLEEAQTMTLRDGLLALRASYVQLHSAASIASQEMADCSNFILEAYDILGQEMDPSWRDTESDLSDERRQLFRKKKDEMKSQVESRMSAVIKCLVTCRQLMEELCWKPKSDLDKRIAGSLVEKDGHWHMVSKLRTEFCVGLQSQALAEVSQRLGELQKVKESRIQKIRGLSNEIRSLWEVLGVTDDYIAKFSEQLPALGISEATIEVGKAELSRLREVKAQQMGKLVEIVRAKIVQHWEALGIPREMRESFREFFMDDEQDFTDKLLEAHENYFKALEEQLETARPLFKLIERREVIVEERIIYQNMLQDPDRWNHQRGKKLTEQLMEEEKMAKRIKQLPKLDESVRKKLAEFEEEAGYEFRFNGQVYSERMAEQEQEWLEHKEALASAKHKKKGDDPTGPKNPLRGTRHNNVKAQSNDSKLAKGPDLPRQVSERFRN